MEVLTVAAATTVDWREGITGAGWQRRGREKAKRRKQATAELSSQRGREGRGESASKPWHAERAVHSANTDDSAKPALFGMPSDARGLQSPHFLISSHRRSDGFPGHSLQFLFSFHFSCFSFYSNPSISATHSFLFWKSAGLRHFSLSLSLPRLPSFGNPLL